MHQRPHRPHELGPRLFRRGRWWGIDLRPYGYGRRTMRDPRHPGWPDQGERTELQDIAEEWKWQYVQWCHTQARRRALSPPKVKLLGEVVEQFLAHRQHHVARQTLINDRAALNHLLDDFGPHTPIEAVKPQRTIDRLLGSTMASTARTYAKYLSSFYTWLELPYKVKLPKEQPRRAVCWSEDQITAIRAAAGNLLLPIDCGLFMGLRMREIWGLEWGDIAGNFVRVQRQYPNEPLKSRRERTTVILPGWEHERGQGRVASGAPDRQSRKFGVVLKDIGLKSPDVLWHSLRHTYARRFLEAEPNMRLLQASLGHASVTTTEQLYNWLMPDAAAEIAEARIHGH